MPHVYKLRALFEKKSAGRQSNIDASVSEETMVDYESVVKNNFTNTLLPFLLSRKERDKEKALTRLATDLNSGGQELGESLEKIHDFVSNAPLSINFWKVILGEKIRNYWELQNNLETLNGEYQVNRNDLETCIYTIGEDVSKKSKEMQNFFDFREGSPRARMNYGAVAFDRDNGGAPRYGKGVFFLKDSVKDYTTYTPFDSYLLFKNTGKNAKEFSGHVAAKDNMYPLIASKFQPRLNKKIYMKLLGKGTVMDWNENEHDYLEWQSHQLIRFKHDVASLALNGLGTGDDYIQTWAQDFSRRNMTVLK